MLPGMLRLLGWSERSGDENTLWHPDHGSRVTRSDTLSEDEGNQARVGYLEVQRRGPYAEEPVGEIYRLLSSTTLVFWDVLMNQNSWLESIFEQREINPTILRNIVGQNLGKAGTLVRRYFSNIQDEDTPTS